jgi:hypothetical protein
LENKQENNPFARMIRETGSSIRKELSDIYFKAGIVGGGKIATASSNPGGDPIYQTED